MHWLGDFTVSNFVEQTPEGLLEARYNLGVHAASLVGCSVGNLIAQLHRQAHDELEWFFF